MQKEGESQTRLLSSRGLSPPERTEILRRTVGIGEGAAGTYNIAERNLTTEKARRQLGFDAGARLNA
jgi:hypothetical protein